MRTPGGLTAPRMAALLEALVILQVVPDDLPEGVRQELVAMVGHCRRTLMSIDTGVLDDAPARLRSLTGIWPGQASVSALVDALSRFMLRGSTLPPGVSPPRSRQLFVADTFSNPAYWQFALKTTLAVMLSYATYTLLDWPGLRTAIVTCFFVALSSLGETVHKLVLRLAGALIGGLLAGLCIVFVLPQFTDIGQLCLLIGGVSLGAAWIATSSELLSYAGLQIAFAFFLGVLQGYAPATDLTVLRDRIVGIFLGNVVVTLIFSSVWPESARSGARAAIAETLRSIGAVLGRQGTQAARARTVQALVRADHFRALSLFELRMLPQHTPTAQLPEVEDIEGFAGAAFVVTSASVEAPADRDSVSRIGQWAEAAADHLLRSAALPALPAAAFHGAGSPTDVHALVARQAIALLELEVQHVASPSF